MYITSAGNYKKELLKHIDADQLPAFLGGDKKDPNGDPRCPSIVSMNRAPQKRERNYDQLRHCTWSDSA